MNKKEMRKKVHHALHQIPIEQHRQLSLDIKKKLLSEPSILNSEIIAITISKHPEVDTYEIIEDLWRLGKKVAVPKCNPKLRTMDFYIITQFSQLETVYMDLKEPIPSETVHVCPKEIDVLIVPGIVYDKNGYRIGYGGGYYDRYLTQFHGTLISLAFELQMVKEVPKESHDIPVDIIITEKNRIDCMNHREEMAE